MNPPAAHTICNIICRFFFPQGAKTCKLYWFNFNGTIYFMCIIPLVIWSIKQLFYIQKTEILSVVFFFFKSLCFIRELSTKGKETELL